MSGPAGEVLGYLEGAEREIAATLSELVRIPTVNPYSGDPQSSGEAAGQRFAAERMRQLGGSTRFVPVPTDVYARGGVLGPRQRDWTGRESLVGSFRFGAGRTRIVFNGHMDTIGVSDFDGDPFSGAVEGDVVRGRGASDCKGGIVAGLYAVRALQRCSAEPDCEILFESVVDEECNGAGAGTLACCLAGVRGDYCLVLDGYAGLVYPGCQGIATAEITVRGRAGHGSTGGVSAVEKLLAAKAAIDRLAAERTGSHPSALVNVGVLRAGVAPWVVPNRGWLSANINYEHAEAEAAERAGLGFCGAEVRGRLEELLAGAADADPWLREHRPELVWVKDVPPYRMADGGSLPDCETFMAAAQEAFRQAWDQDPRVADLSAWGDAAHLSRVGRMPTLGMGAGLAGASHSADEHNLVSNVRKAAAAAALTVLRLAGK